MSLPPPSVAILPSSLLAESVASGSSAPAPSSMRTHRLLRLPNARTGLPALYLVDDAQADIFEVQKIAPEAERSWFLGDEVVQGAWASSRLEPILSVGNASDRLPCSSSAADGRLLLFTPIDPVFLLLPIVLAVSPSLPLKPPLALGADGSPLADHGQPVTLPPRRPPLLDCSFASSLEASCAVRRSADRRQGQGPCVRCGRLEGSRDRRGRGRGCPLPRWPAQGWQVALARLRCQRCVLIDCHAAGE